MNFPDIVPDLKARMPELRGRLLANQPLGEFTWFRVGGPAQAFFMPEDENDLAYFLRNLQPEIPVTVIGAGSNMIVRDGGVAGVVIRLGRGFNEVKIEDQRVTAGTAVLDVMVARAAQTAGVAGLAFLSGIPGTIGGALRMNGGAYGGETKDILIEARGVDREGNLPALPMARWALPTAIVVCPLTSSLRPRRFRAGPAILKRSPWRWRRSRKNVRQVSRATARADPHSKIREDIARGSWSMKPAAVGSPLVVRRSPSFTAIS